MEYNPSPFAYSYSFSSEYPCSIDLNWENVFEFQPLSMCSFNEPVLIDFQAFQQEDYDIIEPVRYIEGNLPIMNEFQEQVEAVKEKENSKLLRAKNDSLPGYLLCCPWKGCHKWFLRFEQVKAHYRTHTEEKPHVCANCSQRFFRATDLKRHLKIHSKVRSFKCDNCMKRFTRKDALSRHQISRTCLRVRERLQM